MNRYLIVIHATEQGYTASSPDVEGCSVSASSLDETVASMRSALEEAFDVCLSNNTSIPVPRGIEYYLTTGSPELRELHDRITSADVLLQLPLHSISTTAYLLSSEANRRHLLQSLEELQSGKGLYFSEQELQKIVGNVHQNVRQEDAAQIFSAPSTLL